MQKWSKKSNSMISTISRGLKTREERAEAIAENERRIAKGLKPKGKVSKSLLGIEHLIKSLMITSYNVLRLFKSTRAR
jgi:hypothetical protein